jgi:adenine phosphoribosyltransferase
LIDSFMLDLSPFVAKHQLLKSLRQWAHSLRDPVDVIIFGFYQQGDAMPDTQPNIGDFVRDIPDFPKPGIMFKDITPLLANCAAFQSSIDQMAEQVSDLKVDVIAAAEARGFLFAAPLALKLGLGMVPIRKPGKLPYKKRSYSYELEYGTDTLEMHVDGIDKGQNVLVVDDLLATGGTVEACCKMIEECEATVVGCSFLIELTFLPGAERLKDYPLFALLKY